MPVLVPIDEAEALERLRRMVAYDKEPTLDTAEMTDLVALARRADQFGLWPSDDSWSPTWDFNAAASVGWLWKAAKVSGDFTFSDDAGSYNRREIFDMCERLAETYRKKALGWIPMSRVDLPWEYVVGNSPE